MRGAHRHIRRLGIILHNGNGVIRLAQLLQVKQQPLEFPNLRRRRQRRQKTIENRRDMRLGEPVLAPQRDNALLSGPPILENLCVPLRIRLR
jgi:hypothetical protein